jgi:hypothetical protein
MKKLIGLILFVAVIAVGANILSKGGLPFKKSLDDEQGQLDRLRSDLRAAENEYRQAGRASGLTGMDTTAQAGPALAKVERIEKELVELEGKLKSDVAKEAAQKLHDEIRDFKNEAR